MGDTGDDGVATWDFARSELLRPSCDVVDDRKAQSLSRGAYEIEDCRRGLCVRLSGLDTVIGLLGLSKTDGKPELKPGAERGLGERGPLMSCSGRGPLRAGVADAF